MSALPPSYHVVGQHALLPQVSHDEAARFNFLANMNRFLSGNMLPAVKLAYERKAKPRFEQSQGRAPETRAEVRKLMSDEPSYQTWSAMRRATMEQRQQAGRSVVLRQRDRLNAEAKALNQHARLSLQADFEVPRYIKHVDQHCMPGGYVEEAMPGDVSAAANYDAGIFATTGGGLGRFSDGGGWAVVKWLQAQHPQFKPKRILDLGCGLGHNTLPLAQAFPDAHVIAVDVAAPMLNYGAARAQSMGVHNVEFAQLNAETLPFADQEFDFVMTCMFLHETSAKAIKRIFAESFRLLSKGGISLHLEQPQYQGMDVYEQFIRDWDAHNNNEPFWSTMHSMDLFSLAVDAGFRAMDCFETGLAAVIDATLFAPAPTSESKTSDAEDYGRKAAWYAFGATRG